MGCVRPSTLLAALLATGCGQGQGPAAHPTPSAAPDDPRVPRARALLKRAETAPLPTPEPPPSPVPRGWAPAPAPEFKPEEVEAIRLLEEAAAANPGRPEAHELLARTLEAPAIRAHEREAAARASRRKTKAPAAPPDQGIDASPARVARAWRAAIEASPAAGSGIDALIRFGAAVGDLDAVEWAHRERIRRARENATAEPLAAYADFLLQSRKDPIAAAEQYKNALLWSPQDAGVKAKLAGLYLDLARGHLEKQEYAAAESRADEAAKYAAPGSAPATAIAEIQQRLSAIRR